MSSSIRVSPAAASRARRLGPAHFAFMRALAQGLPLIDSWQRYMALEGEASDARTVGSTLAWIRTELARAAKKQDRFGTARLVRLDTSRLGASAPKLPSLEEFVEAQGLDDERESEQIAAYERTYGRATQRLRRRAQLVGRQLQALRWLEGLVGQPPAAGDAVAAWFDAALADRLHAADLFTLAQLVERINGVGQRWYVSLRAVGPIKARRVQTWLKAHQDSLGLAVGAHVEHRHHALFTHELARVVAPATDIRPLEKFVVPADLDGRQGANRLPAGRCLLKATTDYEAILAWLKSKRGPTLTQRERKEARAQARAQAASKGRAPRSLGVAGPLDWLNELSNTQRAYRTEAERFLLWAIVQKHTALSSLAHEDCFEYRDFLSDPQPRSRWCGARSRPRWSPLWRPFEGPLSVAAQRRAIMVLRNLFAYLAAQGYLSGNPWQGVTVPRSSAPKVDVGRAFSLEQWAFIQAQVEDLPENSASLRLKFALSFLYATGLRISEAVAAQVDHLRWASYAGQGGELPVEGFELTVIGKGDKPRVVPIPDDVADQLAQYLASRGLDPNPEEICNQGAFLIGRVADAHERAPNLIAPLADGRPGITGGMLARQLTGFFEKCSAELTKRGDHRGAERLHQATTHWLRHTNASHALNSGDVPLPIVKELLGHASLATTSAYITTEQRARMAAVQRFAQRRRDYTELPPEKEPA